MTQLNANQFPHIYKSLGVNTNKLGCIMLDLDPIEVTEMVINGKQDLYSSENPEHPYIQGAVAENAPHLTLLYGLLEKGFVWRSYVDGVLDGWTPPNVQIDAVGAFPSPFADEPYSCIVGHIGLTEKLLEGHQRLQLLPHIDTYPEYKPHMTLAYVKKEAEQKWIDALSSELQNKVLTVNKINYGGNQ